MVDSPFVAACKAALEDYERKRFYGVPHHVAIDSLRRVLTQQGEARELFDGRKAAAGRDE